MFVSFSYSAIWAGIIPSSGASLVTQLAKNACSARDLGLITGLGRRYPGEGNGNLLQYSCLENFMDSGAWWATVHRVAESDTTEVTEHTLDVAATATAKRQGWIALCSTAYSKLRALGDVCRVELWSCPPLTSLGIPERKNLVFLWFHTERRASEFNAL